MRTKIGIQLIPIIKVVFGAILLSSCSKDEDQQEPTPPPISIIPKCLINKVTDGNGKNIFITYNEDGTYKTIKNEIDNTTTSLTYSTGTIDAVVTNAANKLLRKTTFARNKQGLVYGQMREYFDPPGGTTPVRWEKTVYEYTGEQLVKQSGISSYATGITTTTDTWTDGNMTTSSFGESISFNDYYWDKPFQQGDFYNLQTSLYQGIPLGYTIRNQNLLKGFDNTPVNYTFDSDGKISTVSVNGAKVYTLEYQCK
ncbi:MAG: hypothetical protein ACTHMV_11125 [Chitinophagaceae bacterium]